jgi:hypothetical protein
MADFNPIDFNELNLLTYLSWDKDREYASLKKPNVVYDKCEGSNDDTSLCSTNKCIKPCICIKKKYETISKCVDEKRLSYFARKRNIP